MTKAIAETVNPLRDPMQDPWFANAVNFFGLRKSTAARIDALGESIGWLRIYAEPGPGGGLGLFGVRDGVYRVARASNGKWTVVPPDFSKTDMMDWPSHRLPHWKYPKGNYRTVLEALRAALRARGVSVPNNSIV